MAVWYQQAAGRISVSLYVQPGAKRTEVQGLHGDALKIRLAAPPIDGRANQELTRFLAAAFKVPLRNVHLVSGETSRQKRFHIDGSTVEPMSLLDSR
jgi:uncharacterized protein (TIGR00251 family)